MSVKASIAIITINYNHSKETLECVESILQSTYTDFRLFLVDNGSEIDDYNKLCSSIYDERVQIVRQQPNIGYVGGVNLGLKEASKQNLDYYLIMNNDTILDKKAIIELLNTARKYRDQAIVSGKVYNIDEPDSLQYIGQWCRNKNKLDYQPYVKGGKEKDIGQFDEEIELGMADDVFWLVPKQIFKKIGYYSTDFFLYGEQNDYALRALKEGFKLIYTPKAKIWHYHHLTTSGGDVRSNKILYWQTNATLLLAYKHLAFIWFLRFYFRLFGKSFAKFLLSTFKSKTVNDKSIQKTKLLVIKYFTLWFFSDRTPNEGFNPVG